MHHSRLCETIPPEKVKDGRFVLQQYDKINLDIVGSSKSFNELNCNSDNKFSNALFSGAKTVNGIEKKN